MQYRKLSQHLIQAIRGIRMSESQSSHIALWPSIIAQQRRKFAASKNTLATHAWDSGPRGVCGIPVA